MLNAKEKKAQKLLNRAVEWAGSESYLAAEMRVSPQTVKAWISRGKVPGTPARLLAILMAPACKVQPHSLERTLRA